MTREDCPGCNSEPGSWICLFHDVRPKPWPSQHAVEIKRFVDWWLGDQSVPFVSQETTR